LVGIFTERDLMLRVVQRQREIATTLVRDVMTADVMTVTEASTNEEASKSARWSSTWRTTALADSEA
jgi:CBS domain-containing protein